MSMFLVECNELNEFLVSICKSMIQKILKKVEDYVYQDTAQKIQSEIRNMHTTF